MVRHLKASDEELLLHFQNFPGVVAAVVLKDYAKLRRKQSRHVNAMRKLVEAIEDCDLEDWKDRQRVKEKFNLAIVRTRKVDKYKQNFTAQLLDPAAAHELSLSTGFVSFSSAAAAHAAATFPQNHPIRCSLAPKPSAVNWHKAGRGDGGALNKNIWAETIRICLYIVWPIVIGAICSVFEIDKLCQRITDDGNKGNDLNGFQRFVKNQICEKENIKELLKSILTPLFLTIFMAVLPSIWFGLSRLKRLQTRISETIYCQKNNFRFLVIFMFLFLSVFHGLLFETKKREGKDEHTVEFVVKVRDSILNRAEFYIVYTMWQITSVFLELVRIWPIFQALYRTVKRCAIRRRAIPYPINLNLAYVFSRFLFIFFLGLVYSIICPGINLIMFVLFFCLFFIHRYHVVHTFEMLYDCQGEFIVIILNQMMLAVYVFQFCTCAWVHFGDAAGKGNNSQHEDHGFVYSIFPLILASFYFKYYMQAYCKIKPDELSLEPLPDQTMDYVQPEMAKPHAVLSTEVGSKLRLIIRLPICVIRLKY